MGERVEERAENYDNKKNFFRGANKVQKSVIPANAGIQVPLKSLILIDALGLRLTEAPAADILSLDPGAMRQAMFGDPASLLALETIPTTPKAEAIESVILARRVLARFAWQFPDNPRLRRYLQRIQLPTLGLWGERDGIVTTAHGKAYHDGIAKSQFAIIADSGHLPHVEAPETCADIMVEFLRNSSV